MSLVSNKTFTLGDLANISLGATELTNDHLSVLQSLFVILLQKLNCCNEKVRIHGFPAKCIEQLLKDKSNHSQYDFRFEAVKKFQEKYDVLEQLERKSKQIDSKMQKHFEQIRRCRQPKRLDNTIWDVYTSPAEDLCTLCIQHNEKLCALARNATLNMELANRVLPAITERFEKFESKLESMQIMLKELTQKADKLAYKLKRIEILVMDIQEIRCSLNQGNETFLEAITETEEMLDCKLNRLALPALKIYLERRFVKIREHLKNLMKASEKGPPSRPLVIKDKKTCVSCSLHQDFISLQKTQTFKSLLDKKEFCGGKWKVTTIVDKMRASAYW